MVEINIKTVDELHAVLSELTILTYLQELVHYDSDEDILEKGEFDYVAESANIHLRHQQFKVLKRFKRAIESI